ncbi:MAG: hypothetical protein IPN61_01975 [Bacteroidetes bacterium]|nr:hypothetical protein [Bacteroidota bacterium]
MLSENFDISYGLGTLTIVPETLTVKANDTTAGCNGVQPAYTFTNSIYQYEDADSNVIASGPVFTILDNMNVNVGSGNLAGGTYQIVPSDLVQADTPANYILVYEPGVLTVDESLTLSTSREISIVMAAQQQLPSRQVVEHRLTPAMALIL